MPGISFDLFFFFPIQKPNIPFVSLVVVEWFPSITSSNISGISRAAHSFPFSTSFWFSWVHYFVLSFKANFDSLYLFIPLLIFSFFKEKKKTWKKKRKKEFIPYYLFLFTRMCLTVCVVLISCFLIFPKILSWTRIRAVVVYMLLLKSCGFPFILNPVFFFSSSFSVWTRR